MLELWFVSYAPLLLHHKDILALLFSFLVYQNVAIEVLIVRKSEYKFAIATFFPARFCFFFSNPIVIKFTISFVNREQ